MVNEPKALIQLTERLIEETRVEEALKVQRFQDALKNPYVEQTGAAALFCNSIYNADDISKTTSCVTHPNAQRLALVVIRANTFMKLVHCLYKRAANEA